MCLRDDGPRRASALPAPAELQDSVEKSIDRALDKRPDLIAKVAALRATRPGVIAEPDTDFVMWCSLIHVTAIRRKSEMLAS